MVEEIVEADAVVVGGGPAGLSAATALKRLGVISVVLLERDSVVGGIPRHCGHSPFGMREFHRILSGTRYVARLEAEAKEVGVDIRTRHSVLSVGEGEVSVISPDGPLRVQANRTVLATGARETPRSARLVSGERPLGVLNTAALQAYVHLEKLVPFKQPVIVGTELVAMSALLTCRSAGIRPVAIVEPNDWPTTRFPFYLLPRLLGVPLHYGTSLDAIGGKGRVSEVTIRNGTQTRTIACDGVLFTGAFTPESALARMSGLAIDDASGGPMVDGFGRTSSASVFAAGNLLRPIETAGWCWAEGKRIAASVFADIRQRLPDRGRTVRVHAGEGIKLVMPQEINQGTARLALPDLQVRLSAKIRGTLKLSLGTGTIWSRTIDSTPERRILIPIAGLTIPDGATDLTLSVDSQ
ncbi:NAD(P)/FAD-dependent oxidoreductase [Labrys okinawensis]|uniref:NAD(P)/FAD-dependent oxidoreductase n=1 Tax=Labrys okinawensis TaxID=346911 RepID=UPI0039BCF140